MHLDPLALPPPDRYKLLIGGIVPRPIAWVSTLSTQGVTNLAPFSFFTGVGSDPMTLLFCPANKPDGSEKDSLRNAAPRDQGGTGEFVVSVVSHALAKPMALSAEDLPHDQSEYDMPELRAMGINPAPSAVVAPPRVAQSPLAFECETLQIVRTNPGTPNAGNIVLGRVVSLYAAEGVLNDRLHADPSVLDVVARMGGDAYCTTRDRFVLPRGRQHRTEAHG
jgi:flavin reductase (DIM6/NTAB) family NADH-FMN oxidoreductase RutF